MKKQRKGLAAAVILILAGLLVAGISLASVGFDFSKLSTGVYVTNTREISDPVRNISILGDTDDIVFLPSPDGACRVVCRERDDAPHLVEAADGTLKIESAGRRKWRMFDFSFWTEGPTVTVYLPLSPESSLDTLEIRAGTGDVKLPADFTFERAEIRLSTGDVDFRSSVTGLLSVGTGTGSVRLSGLSAGDISLSTGTGSIRGTDIRCVGDFGIEVSTGRAELENVACGSLTSAGGTGAMVLKNVTASGAFTLRRGTGSILFDACDAEEITVATGTGSVTGTLLTGKDFRARSDTGRVEVPEDSAGGKCEITTSTGGIRIGVQDAP